MRSFQKLDMASTDWLTTHFLAKSAYRAREITTLPIQAGAQVLDMCCGPGLFMPSLLNLVGPEGHVTGVDLDPVSLDAAHARLIAQPHRNWSLTQSKFEDYLEDLAQFDVVLLFNCIGYFGDPAEIVRNIGSRLKPGSRLIVKDFDLEGFFFQPRSIMEWAGLVEAAKRRNDGDNPVSFDNFLGRRIHTLHEAFPFRDHKSTTWTQMMAFPFNDYEAEYIWRNVECLLNQAGDTCPPHIAQYFRRNFERDGAFYYDPTAMFIETEYLISLTV